VSAVKRTRRLLIRRHHHKALSHVINQSNFRHEAPLKRILSCAFNSSHKTMLSSSERQPFDPSNYKQPFLDVMNEFHCVMSNHHGRRDKITSRRYTVEMTYFFPPVPDGTCDSTADSKIVLNLSHNKAGVFTKHHFQGEGDKPLHYMTLKEDIDKVGIEHSSKARTQCTCRSHNINVFDEVRRALEGMGCKNVSVKYLRCGLKFVGETFGGVKFRFIVYTTKEERVNTRSGKRISVWEEPVSPPVDLKLKIDQVLRWVRDIEAGRLSADEIDAETPSDNDMDDLVVGMANLNFERGGR
jgi:hypothetical protein